MEIKPNQKLEIWIVSFIQRLVMLKNRVVNVFGRIGKEKVIVYGNCHTIVIIEYLLQSKSFNNHYYIQQIPMFYEKGVFDCKLLKGCKLFIHQDIREENKFGKEFSSDYIKGILGKECICICIPNLYELGYGFFPQSLVQSNNPKYYNKRNPEFIKGDDRGLFVHGDRILEQQIDNNCSLNDIIEYAHSDNILSNKEITDIFNTYKAKILRREDNWDIKIFDFIFENDHYKEEQMFTDFGHPTNIVLKKIVERLLDRIENTYNDITSIEINRVLDQYEDPIYPYVAKVLGLKYSKKYIRVQSNMKIRKNMDFDEYVKEYYYWCSN